MQLNIVEKTPDRVPLRNAIVSVADKSGLNELLTGLWNASPEMNVYSTGGTLQVIRSIAQNLGALDRVVAISEYTGQPEMQGGLVKTLDWRIYLGLLSETFNADHQQDLTRHEAIEFDLTVCNFYPFEDRTSQVDAGIEDGRTHIDIGGPTMIRASAKNFLRVATLCNPEEYSRFLSHVAEHDGSTRLSYRFQLMKTAFQYTAAYDKTIADYFRRRAETDLDRYDLDVPGKTPPHHNGPNGR